MLRPTCCLLALLVVPSLAFAQATPPPSVRGHRIEATRADPMPQGIKELLVFSGAPAEWRPPPIQSVSPPIKGLSSADKLALVRRAAGTSGASPAGSSMGPYLMLSRAMMRTEGRGQVTFWQSPIVSPFSTTIGARSANGKMELVVESEAPGGLYLAEFQVSGNVARGVENACRLLGSGRELTFRLSGRETTIIPAVFESGSHHYYVFQITCDAPWRFISVEVNVLR